MKVITHTLLLCLVCIQLKAQSKKDTEFPKEFIMHLKLHNGLVTNFTNLPEVYTGGLQIVPQYTIVPQKIRAGVIADLYYTSKKVSAAFGPTFSYKLKTFRAAPFGSLGNINVNFDHLWGTNKERLIGAGINADIANKIVLGLSLHRDYNLNTWWIQNTVGLRISSLKKTTEIFNQ
jgi:hypothetical protein